MAHNMRKLNKGFTLLEMLISMACLAIILTFSVPSYGALQVRNDLNTATVSMVNSCRRAQFLAQSANGDSEWGVHVATGSILIYKGATYALRDSTFDENTTLSPSISFSGLSDVTFSKLFGIPNAIGTTTLTSTTNEIRIITINEKGFLQY